MQMQEQLATRTWDCEELISTFPPVFRHPTKQRLYNEARKKNANLQGNLIISRFRAIPLPSKLSVSVKTKFSYEENVFQYRTYDPATEYHWHLNFANRYLFTAYGGGLYAQDEMQVMEHPILGSVKEFLDKEARNRNSQLLPFTCTGENVPTPVLMEGVPRLLEVDCSGNGLYGNGFGRAPFETIERYLRYFTPTGTGNSNIIAIEAPAGGYGMYNTATINAILSTAFSGFKAAVLRSKLVGENVKTVIHTGHWGTGAYGGNRELMVLLQLIAAHLAEVDEFVFHTFDFNGTCDYEAGMNLFEKITENPIQVSKLINNLATKNFVWGVSDGN